MKNILMNSDFQVWQNGASYDTPDYSTTADRYVWGGSPESGAEYSITRSNDVPDSTMAHSYTILTTSPSSGSGGGHARYGMEGFDLKRVWGKECVLSFWLKSNKTGAYSIAVSNAEDRTFIADYTVDSADTWEFKEIPIRLDTVSGGTWNFGEGKGLKIRWSFSKDPGFIGSLGWNNDNLLCSSNQVNLFSSTGNYFKMTAVQFHEGTTAGPFIPVDYPTDLLRCMRYQQVFTNLDMQRTVGSSCATATTVRIPMPISVPLASGSTQNPNAPFATLVGIRGTDWRLRNTADNSNTTGTFNGTSLNLGRAMPLLRFEDGSYTANAVYHIQFITNNGKLRFNAEII